MKVYLTLVILFSCIVCNAQTKPKDTDSLFVNFYPSFISSSKLLIIRTENSSIIQLEVRNPNKIDSYIDEVAKLKRGTTDSLWKFLKTYNFKIKGNIDTIGSYKTVDKKGDSTLDYSVSIGVDGIRVNGVFNDGNALKFAFWSPKKGTENHKLMSIVFSLMNQAFKNKEAVHYTEQLSQYFSFGLGLKQLSSSPLKYKLFGTLTGNEELQLKNFFNSLPQKPNIAIDVANLRGMGTIMYPLFKTFMNSHKNIYWINPNDIILSDFYKIGVPSSRITSAKKVIGIKTNKDGREEIVTEPQKPTQ